MKPNYYAIIPANVRYSNIKPNAKLLYGEITALSNKLGYCFASNTYFADLYGVSKNTVSRWLSDLKKSEFITINIERNSNKQITKRIIGIVKKVDTPIDEKSKDNNTSINTTSNNIYIKEKFISEVNSFEYEDCLKEDFIDYWCEGKKQMRWQKQPTFDISLRLKRWAKNSKKFNKGTKGTSKIEMHLQSQKKAEELLKKYHNDKGIK